MLRFGWELTEMQEFATATLTGCGRKKKLQRICQKRLEIVCYHPQMASNGVYELGSAPTTLKMSIHRLNWILYTIPDKNNDDCF